MKGNALSYYSVGTAVEEKIKDMVNGKLQEWKFEGDEEAKSFKELLAV